MTPKAGKASCKPPLLPPRSSRQQATRAEMGTRGFPATLPPRSFFFFSRTFTNGIFPGSGIAGQAAHGIPCPNTAVPPRGRGTFPGPDPVSLSHLTGYVSTDAHLGVRVNASINIRSTSQIASKEPDVPGKAGKVAVPCPRQLVSGDFGQHLPCGSSPCL